MTCALVICCCCFCRHVVSDEKGSNAEPNIVSIRREVTVLDRNDNAPKFGETNYVFPVDETAAVNSQIFNKIFVSDADAGLNAAVKLTCLEELSPVGCSKFNLKTQQISPGKYAGILTVRQSLNYEEDRRYTMLIQAEDSSEEVGGSLSSTATVIVEIQDTQDQLPVFLNAPYRTIINENSPPGLAVYTVSVRDGDVGQPRKLKLEIVNEPGGYFEIASFEMDDDNVAVATIVTTERPIDREMELIVSRGGVYTFALKATELVNNQPTNDSSVEDVHVVVVDVNDEAPFFEHNQYTVGAPESIGIGEALPGLQMLVVDKDTTFHGQFELSLVAVRNADNMFEVYPQSATGRTPVLIKIVDASRLDYENADQREMLVHVVARGGAALSSTATVTIQLTDVNDNAPTFQFSSYRYSVRQ